MSSWITTKQLLLRQDAKSLHTRNREKDACGRPTGNMDIRLALQCIITDVKMYTSPPRSMSASWTLSSSFHHYQMPQLLSTNRFIMDAKYMTEALQNPHPEVPFAQVRDDTVSALAELAAIFKLKLRQTPAVTLPAALLKVIQRPCLAESSNPLFCTLSTQEANMMMMDIKN
jgi:hypothetical protein